MLFNSLSFILLFLPISLLSFYLLAKLKDHRWAEGSLCAFSLLFYGWVNWSFVLLLIGSMLFNFLCGALILKTADSINKQKALLAASVGANILLLFGYKYLFPLLHALDAWGLHTIAADSNVLLPLGISFFTFTQIGYLVDCQAGIVTKNRFLDYLLFVTIFPHLIAGPILHHKEMIPQFANRATYEFKLENIGVGATIFIIGLFKKVVIADHFAPLANFAFSNPGLLAASALWGGVLAYALELYFDFAGYSEMAIGLARLFGIRFPANFNSPYKATSIIDYWQRWHMTLTRFLMLYIYTPIALNVARRRMARGQSVNKQATQSLGGFSSMILLPTFITMALAGIWHGAGTRFLIYGFLHAAYLSINHAWRTWGYPIKGGSAIGKAFAVTFNVVLTFTAVVIAQVFYRAASVDDAIILLKGMFGLPDRASITPLYLNRDVVELVLRSIGIDLDRWMVQLQFGAPATVLLGFFIVWALPNTMQIMDHYQPSLSRIDNVPRDLEWKPNIAWGMCLGFMAAFALLAITGTSEFIYFRF
jgi:alginate O-acetyltransferase complex protein AlgI